MTSSAILASFIAALALAFFEGMGRFYPARATWERLRRTHGRRAVRAMRERFEAAASRNTARRLAATLMALVFVWVALADALDKFWYEVLLDAAPYIIVSIALFRTRAVLLQIAARMRAYEDDSGDDDEHDAGLGSGPTELAL